MRETFPMRAQQLAVNNEKTVGYRIVRMVDLWEMESQGEMRWICLMVMCGVFPYVHVDGESQSDMRVSDGVFDVEAWERG